ncbi:MAG: cytochrome c [Rhodospirillales bacterium]|nr:cytochrome c [Rhodospirillales bacterium]MDP6774414.1 cytochrome c [Rhodospirillales bacterium]
MGIAEASFDAMGCRAPSLALAAAALVATGPAGAEGDAGKGRRLAIEHCSRCHVIDDYNRFGGIGSTPSFQILAHMPDYLERFQTFYARRPHPTVVNVPGVEAWTKLPAFVVKFTVRPEDIDALVTFVETLRKK